MEWNRSASTCYEEEVNQAAEELEVRSKGNLFIVRLERFDRESLLDLASKGDRLDYISSADRWLSNRG